MTEGCSYGRILNNGGSEFLQRLQPIPVKYTMQKFFFFTISSWAYNGIEIENNKIKMQIFWTTFNLITFLLLFIKDLHASQQKGMGTARKVLSRKGRGFYLRSIVTFFVFR